MIARELATAALLLFGFAAWIAGAFVSAYSRGVKWRKQRNLSAAQLPEIREALVDYLAGSNDRTRLRGYVQSNRVDSARAILEFQDTAGGGARDRLCELAMDLGLVHDWLQEAKSRDTARRRVAFANLAFVCSYEPCLRLVGDLLLSALEDPDHEVRLSASRGLLQSGGEEETARVFELALTGTLLTRILLAEDLRRHASDLCRQAVPAALRAEKNERILAALEILVGWECALPLEGLHPLMGHLDPSIRVLALRLAPVVTQSPENESAVLRALADPEPEVCEAAASAAGRLRLDAALPLLARCLRSGNRGPARTAAAALATMPPLGWQTLEELTNHANIVTSDAATEALERVRRKAAR